MTRDELIAHLNNLAESTDPEEAHMYADGALLDYINDPAITDAWDAVEKWYA